MPMITTGMFQLSIVPADARAQKAERHKEQNIENKAQAESIGKWHEIDIRIKERFSQPGQPEIFPQGGKSHDVRQHHA